MKQRYGILMILILTVFSCSTKKSLVVAGSFRTNAGWNLPYQFYKPKFKNDKKQPLILFLHGAGERGNDNRKQLIHVIPYITSDSFQQKHPCYILAPQCPSDNYWAPVNRFEWSFIQGGEMTNSMTGVLELLDQIQRIHEIDSERIYIVGLSMGGFGTFDLTARRPDLFAAGVPICGGGDLSRIENIKKTPLWIFHGEKDSVVPVQKTREIFEAIKKEEKHFLYTEYQGKDHGIWEIAIRENGLWEWVFSQEKTK
jgi:predicted peptidase